MLILYLAVIIVAAKIAGAISVRFGQPSVLGELIVGVLLGPSVLGLIEANDLLSAFSTIGVILLMFIAGLETDLQEFKKSAKSATFVGFGGIVFPLFLGYAAGMLMDLSALQSWFIGVTLSATSVSISVQALKEMNQLKSPEGATILGAAVIDDVVVMIILAFLLSFAGGGDTSITTVVMYMLVFFVAATLIAWKGIPWIMATFKKLPVSEPLMSIALIICFVYAYFAEVSGVASIIGAYIAGIAIGTTSFKQVIFEKVETVGYSLFVPIFFAYIGISAEFSGLLDNWLLIVGLSVLAILTKFVGAGIGAKLTGYGWNSSMGIGSAMVSRGEVALIVAAIGLEGNLIPEDLFATMIVVVIVTTLVTPPMMKIFFNKGKSEVKEANPQ